MQQKHHRADVQYSTAEQRWRDASRFSGHSNAVLQETDFP